MRRRCEGVVIEGGRGKMSLLDVYLDSSVLLLILYI